jgi:GMP synthase (glutamine-hydrolysing)
MPVVSLPAVDAGGRPLFVIRPIVSTDAMTADVYPMGVQRLVELSRLIEHECGPAVLLYDLTSKPPATIEWE